MDGTLIHIGDTVEWFENDEVAYTFTVDTIGNKIIWGADIPETPYGTNLDTREPNYNMRNWHISVYSRVIKPKSSWEGSTIKFNFI